MKEEALKLADELDLIAGMIAIGDRIKWGQDSELMENGSAMIRRLVEELDKPHPKCDKSCMYLCQTKPLSDEEINQIAKDELIGWACDEDMLSFARAIEESHGIK